MLFSISFLIAILLFIESTNQVKSINSGKLEIGEKCFPFSQFETSFVANGSANIKKWLFSIKDLNFYCWVKMKTSELSEFDPNLSTSTFKEHKWYEREFFLIILKSDDGLIDLILSCLSSRIRDQENSDIIESELNTKDKKELERTSFFKRSWKRI